MACDGVDCRRGREELSVNAYMSPPILIFDVLTCYGGIMNHLYGPVCLKSGQSSNLPPTGLWTDGTTRCVYEPRVVYDVSCSLLLVSAVYSCCNLTIPGTIWISLSRYAVKTVRIEFSE